MSSTVNFCRENGGGAVGNGCVGHDSSPGHVALRHGPLLDRPQRLAGHAIEDLEESLLAGLRDDVDLLAVVADGEELGRGREVVVPEVVVHHLEMPEPLAGAGIEREQAIAEEIGAFAVGAVKIVRSASRSGHRAMPRFSSIAISPQTLAPPAYFQASFGQVSYPNSPGRGMVWKVQTMLAGADVVGADVAGRRAVALAGDRAHDDQVLENAAGVPALDVADALRVAVEALAQIDAAVLAERVDR